LQEREKILGAVIAAVSVGSLLLTRLTVTVKGDMSVLVLDKVPIKTMVFSFRSPVVNVLESLRVTTILLFVSDRMQVASGPIRLYDSDTNKLWQVVN
jgi:hypothetical protein